MQKLLLGIVLPLLLCFGSAVVFGDGKMTTRRTLFEAYSKTALSTYLSNEYQVFVYSYHVPSLAEAGGVMFAVAEARYATYKGNYAGEVVVKYSADQGNTWKTIVAIPRTITKSYARSVLPTIVPQKGNLRLFAEKFEEWTDDWTDYKSGNGDFVHSLSYNVTNASMKPEKSILTFYQPTSLIPELSNEMKRLEIKRLIGGYGRGIEVNGSSIIHVWFINTKDEMRPTVLISGPSNWRLAGGTGDPGSLESAVVEWEGKLIMNSRTNDGYRKVYESTNMGKTWKEALSSLSRVWGNSPNRQGIGCSASFISVTIENTSVMLFSYPLNTKGGVSRDKLHLWLTDNKRIYNVGQISAEGENTGHSSLLYTNSNLYCLYEKDKYETQKYYSSVLAHLVDELKNIKAVVKKWKNQDKAFSEACDKKDLNPSYPGSTCEVHIPTNGLVGFLSDEGTTDTWKDAYSCVDAKITHGVKVKNGIQFKKKGGGAMWPVGRQGQNQRYHFMNHKFTLAATVTVHECRTNDRTPILSVVLDQKSYQTLIDGVCRGNGYSTVNQHQITEEQSSLVNDKPVRLAITFHNGIVKLYGEGKFITSRTYTLTSGLLSTPILYICILDCGKSNLKRHAQATVQNVLLYNRVLSKEELELLYLPIVQTMTNTISKTNSRSKILSKIETPLRTLSHTITQSLSHTGSESQSLSHSHDAIEGGMRKGINQGSSLKRDKYKYSKSESKSSESTRNPLHYSHGVCPSIIVETVPSSDLTQKDIDGSNKGKRILLVSLPKKLYWPNNDSVGSLISFSRGSGAHQPNGFSGKWGEILRSVTWRRNTTNPRSVLEVEIPTYSNYNIESDEEIVISVDARALCVDCKGPLNGSFTIRAENVSKIVKTSKVVNSVIAGMTTVTIFCAGGVGSLLEIQALSLLSRMNCAPIEERYGFNLLPYFTSIFVHFGSLWIVLGNALIVIIFGCIHYGITVVYKKMRGGNSSKAWARMLFPSLTYFVAYIMHIGILVHSVSLLFIMKSELHRYVMCAVGTSYGFIFPFYVVYFVARYIDVKVVPYKHTIEQLCFIRCMSPLGYWTPRNQVKMYGSIFYSMNDKHLYWCVFHLFVLCIAGIVTVIPTPTDRCHIQHFCLMGIFLLGSIVTAVTNMMRSVFLTSMHTLSFFLLATLCCIGGLNYVLPNKSLLDTYFLLTVILLIIVFIISIYNAIIVVYDWMYVKNDSVK